MPDHSTDRAYTQFLEAKQFKESITRNIASSALVVGTEVEQNGSTEEYLKGLMVDAQVAANNLVRKTRAYRINKRKASQPGLNTLD